MIAPPVGIALPQMPHLLRPALRVFLVRTAVRGLLRTALVASQANTLSPQVPLLSQVHVVIAELAVTVPVIMPPPLLLALNAFPGLTAELPQSTAPAAFRVRT